MINYEAFFKLSYGLFIVCSGNKNRGNGYIANTVFQVTSEPPKFAICCNKNNLTAEFIQGTKLFSVSILQQDAKQDIIGRFGYKSGKDINKFEGMNIKYGENDVPILLNDTIAFIVCKVVQTIDVGSHFMFIGEAVQSKVLDENKEPLTYSYYRNVNKGLAPKNAPTYIDKSKYESKTKTFSSKKYLCTACGHIYDDEIEEIKFEDLPEDWVCPICGTEKADFIEKADF